jgi:hypothetical protein
VEEGAKVVEEMKGTKVLLGELGALLVDTEKVAEMEEGQAEVVGLHIRSRCGALRKSSNI